MATQCFHSSSSPMTHQIFCVLCVIFSFVLVPSLADDVEACVAACDNFNTTELSTLITICGTDLRTHFTNQAAYSGSMSCYGQCGVGLYHIGPCGCPNTCYNDLGHGTCNIQKQECECASGWGGADCSLVTCPNSCDGHGECGTVEGVDTCTCKQGWTGADCSVAVDPILSKKLPQVVPGNYYADDKFGDDHPVFRHNVLGTVRVNMDTKDWLYCLYPQNAYNQSYVKAQFIFNNGNISTTIEDVGIRIKGAASRYEPKKSYSIKFNTEKGRKWKGLKGLSLKMALGAKAVSNQLTVDFYRSMLVPTYRTSFVELWINDIFLGLYTAQEKFDDEFVESRFNVKNAYLYKLGMYDLSYQGANETSYQNLSYGLDGSNPEKCVQQSEGDGNWTSFVDLISSLNSTAFSSKTFDIDTFVRAMVLEAFTQNLDGYNGLGNNYFLANSKKDRTYWTWIAQDFDFALGSFNRNRTSSNINSTGIQIREEVDVMPELSGDIFTFQCKTKPLTKAVFALPNVQNKYVDYFKKFINSTFILSRGLAVARLEAFTKLAYSVISRDRYYSATASQSLGTFMEDCTALRDWVNNRYANVSAQVASYVPAPYVPDPDDPQPTQPPHKTASPSSNGGMIAGVTMGAIGGLVVVGAIGFFVYKRNIKPYAHHQVLPRSLSSISVEL